MFWISTSSNKYTVPTITITKDFTDLVYVLQMKDDVSFLLVWNFSMVTSDSLLTEEYKIMIPPKIQKRGFIWMRRSLCCWGRCDIVWQNSFLSKTQTVLDLNPLQQVMFKILSCQRLSLFCIQVRPNDVDNFKPCICKPINQIDTTYLWIFYFLHSLLLRALVLWLSLKKPAFQPSSDNVSSTQCHGQSNMAMNQRNQEDNFAYRLP